MAPVKPHAALVGRAAETRLLEDLVGDARRQGGTVVLRGDAGIGKTALLLAASRVAQGDGMQVLSTTAVESEARLPFAGLHMLVRPILGQVDQLAAPQHDALLTAFGMTKGDVPDLFLVALAALNLIAEAASHTPILLRVEDAHWLDASSAQVLVFIARRLESEPVVLLVSVREGFPSAFDDAGLPELRLQPLDEAAASELLSTCAPDLLPVLRRRLLDEAAGNPLALVELSVVVGRISEGAVPPMWLPLTTRLERAFAARVSGLPPLTRTLLQVAALNDGEDLSEAIDAAAILSGGPVSIDDLTPAIDVGLIDVEDTVVSFRHPLMRSAIRQRSSVAQRAAAHGALAQLLAADAERSVWHRAAASPGRDEAVACELDVAAERAQRRGAIEVAEAAWERAARLSEVLTRRGERLLCAAELSFELGRRDSVVGLLQEAGRLDLTQAQRWRLAWIQESFDDGVPGSRRGAASMAELAEGITAAGDVDLALKLLSGAALRCWWGDSGPGARELVVAAADRVTVEKDDARLLAIFAFAAPIDRGAMVSDRLHRLVGSGDRTGQAARLLGNAATAVGDFDVASVFLTAALTDLRAQGRLGLLARALALQAWSAAQLADLAVAIPAAEEAVSLATETGQPLVAATARVTQSLLAALRGDHDAAEELAQAAEQATAAAGAHGVLAAVEFARGVNALGRGHHVDAFEHLQRLYEPLDPAYHLAIRCFAIGDLAEAALHSGRSGPAGDVVAAMEEVALLTPSAALHCGIRFARALLANDPDKAEELFEAALRPNLRRWPFARARAQLAYGEWLRRHRRDADSRVPLRAAQATFDALGTLPWGERARQELRASGETSRRRTPEALDQLTPQELQITQLAAQGLTNREIGQRLYLSHRTVSSHLYRIFPKLGVTSRSELGASLHRPS